MFLAVLVLSKSLLIGRMALFIPNDFSPRWRNALYYEQDSNQRFHLRIYFPVVVHISLTSVVKAVHAVMLQVNSKKKFEVCIGVF